jgi:hypothetical protein
MRRIGSAAYTRDTLRALRADLQEQLLRLGGHETLVALLDSLEAQLDEGTDPPSPSPEPVTTSLLNDGKKYLIYY